MALRTKRDRWLEGVLLGSLVVHGAALLTMAGLLLPAMPGAGLATADLRLGYLLRLGLWWHLAWVPWHLSAASDVLLSAALVAVRWVRRWVSVPTLLVTLVAFALEQRWEVAWNVLAPGFHSAAAYAPFEAQAATAVTVYAAGLYAVMAIGWSGCLWYSGEVRRGLLWVGAIAWPTLLFASLGPLLPEAVRPADALLQAGNKVGFPLLMVWYVLALEAVLRRTRRDEAWGGMAAWRAPWPGLFGWACEVVANSRFLRYGFEFVPALNLSSDVEDVVYVNYLVEAERVARLLPAGLELQLLGGGRYTMVTVLTYRHGHFGPTLLGGLRRWVAPSPVQSNWRLYVREPVGGTDGVYFLSTVISNTLMALTGRLIAYCVPMHRGLGMRVEVVGSEVTLGIGTGGGFGLAARLRVSEAVWPAAGVWAECFGSFEEFAAYCVPQERTLYEQAWDGRITSQEITLGSAVGVRMLGGTVESATLAVLTGEAEAVCFLLPRVAFRLEGERVLRKGVAG